MAVLKLLVKIWPHFMNIRYIHKIITLRAPYSETILRSAWCARASRLKAPFLRGARRNYPLIVAECNGQIKKNDKIFAILDSLFLYLHL